MREKGLLFHKIEFQLMNVDRMIQVGKSQFSKDHIYCCR